MLESRIFTISQTELEEADVTGCSIQKNFPMCIYRVGQIFRDGVIGLIVALYGFPQRQEMAFCHAVTAQ